MTGVIIVSIYFVVGAVATAIVNHRKPEGAKDRWVKYLVYLIIVFTLLFFISRGYMFEIAVLISAIGLIEVIRIGVKNNQRALLIGLPVYAALIAGFLMFAYGNTDGVHLQVYVVVLTFDGISQITGQLFGKRKLAPSISPGKTIEGSIGGFVVAAGTTMLVWDWSPGAEMLLAIIICVASLAGDLLASAYKRQCLVKDYSKLIPGHGGVLDRFDSLIAAGCAWTLFRML